MTKPHFIGWHQVENGYYTKTRLRNEFGLKPVDLQQYDATLKAKTPQGWKDFVLYHINNTVEIKRQKIADIEPTLTNIAEALYVINKSAKISRDTKVNNYSLNKHQVVAGAKTRQIQLYELKNAVIEKLLQEKKIFIIGYHKQQSNWKNGEIYLMLVKIEEFTFHLPVTKKDIQSYNYPGTIDKISAVKTRKTHLKFHESKRMLEKYIMSDCDGNPNLQ